MCRVKLATQMDRQFRKACYALQSNYFEKLPCCYYIDHSSHVIAE